MDIDCLAQPKQWAQFKLRPSRANERDDIEDAITTAPLMLMIEAEDRLASD